MADLETLKELKILILEKITEEELQEKYETMVSKSVIFKTNKRTAYHIIAGELNVDLEVAVASASKEAFPLKIGQVKESEKTNFNFSGYLVTDPRSLITKKAGKLMVMLEMADDTGVITIASFEEQADPILESGFGTGDFVKLSNLYWPDKNQFIPIFGQYSSIVKVEPPYDLSAIIVNTIAQLKQGEYSTIKGMITYVPTGEKKEVYHCETGHWFKKLSDSDIGTQSMCDKCGVPMYVEKHMVGNGVLFSDAEGDTELDIGTFARLDTFDMMDEFILTGKFDDGKFKVSSAVPVKKV